MFRGSVISISNLFINPAGRCERFMGRKANTEHRLLRFISASVLLMSGLLTDAFKIHELDAICIWKNEMHLAKDFIRTWYKNVFPLTSLHWHSDLAK